MRIAKRTTHPNPPKKRSDDSKNFRNSEACFFSSLEDESKRLQTNFWNNEAEHLTNARLRASIAKTILNLDRCTDSAN